MGYAMGMSEGTVKLCLELWQRGWFKSIHSVLEMGSQELRLPKPSFDRLLNYAGITDYDDGPFADLAKYPNKSISTKPFYELLGVEEYSSIDLNGQRGAIIHDLNFPFTDSSMFGRFDLVTDYGSNEHVFNVSETYKTMHKLCKPLGLMVIHQSMFGGNGYYNFDIAFFESLAAANHYKIIFSSFLIIALSDTYHIPVSTELLSYIDFSKVPHIDICYVMQRQTDQDFQYPYDRGMLAYMQNNAGYELQFLPNPPGRVHVPIVMDNISWKTLLSTLANRLLRKVKRIARVG